MIYQVPFFDLAITVNLLEDLPPLESMFDNHPLHTHEVIAASMNAAKYIAKRQHERNCLPGGKH